jgi:hypothetical protein
MPLNPRATAVARPLAGLLCLAPLLAAPALAQKSTAGLDARIAADQASLTAAERHYDEAMTRANAAAEHLVDAKTAENQQEYDTASQNAFNAFSAMQTCRDRCAADQKTKEDAKWPEGSQSVGLAGALAYMLMGLYAPGGGMAEVDPPPLQLDDGPPPPPPEHSVINDLRPPDTFTGDTSGFTPPSSPTPTSPPAMPSPPAAQPSPTTSPPATTESPSTTQPPRTTQPSPTTPMPSATPGEHLTIPAQPLRFDSGLTLPTRAPCDDGGKLRLPPQYRLRY